MYCIRSYSGFDEASCVLSARVRRAASRARLIVCLAAAFSLKDVRRLAIIFRGVSLTPLVAVEFDPWLDTLFLALEACPCAALNRFSDGRRHTVVISSSYGSVSSILNRCRCWRVSKRLTMDCVLV